MFIIGQSEFSEWESLVIFLVCDLLIHLPDFGESRFKFAMLGLDRGKFLLEGLAHGLELAAQRANRLGQRHDHFKLLIIDPRMNVV